MQMARSETPETEDSLHIRIHQQCGACRHLFSPGDRMVAMCYEEKSIPVYDALTYTNNGYCLQPKGKNIVFCKMPSCEDCFAGDESVTVHADCFRLFRKYCNVEGKCRRLWIAGTQMYPWRRAPPLELAPDGNAPSEIISNAAGFRTSLPPELANIVSDNLKLHILLRFCRVLQLAQDLGSAELDKPIIYPLGEVLFWSRGTSPTFIQPGQIVDPRQVRLTVDSRGIKSIGRIAAGQQEMASGLSDPSHAYVVVSVAQLSEVGVEFQLGMSRLQVPTSVNLRIWNVPLPPSPQSITSMKPLDKSSSLAFASVNLDPTHCTGVSFFVTKGHMIAIHGHTKRAPEALQMFEYLHRMRRGHVAWIFIPITAKDKAIAVGTRTTHGVTEPYSIVLKMKSGDNIIGFPSSGKDADESMYTMEQHDTGHLTLIHDVSTDKKISFIGVDKMVKTTSRIIPSINDHPIPLACPSYASLEGVANAHVFTDNETGICRGILLEYDTGMERALGQCRLGFDLVRRYERPAKLDYKLVKYCHPRSKLEFQGVHVAFDLEAGQALTDDGPKWESCEMKGVLRFLFSLNEVILQIDNPEN